MKKLSEKDKKIHDQFSNYGKNAKEWMLKCVLMLPTIEKNCIWAKKGFSSIYEYAAKLAGMNRNKVNEGLRILQKTENLPSIRKVIEQKGLFAVKPVVNLATPATDNFWAKKAAEMSKSTLETFIKDFKKEQHLVDRPGAGSPTNNGLNKATLFQPDEDSETKIQISMKLDQKIVDELKKIKGEGDWNHLMQKLLKCSQKELEAEQKSLEEKEKCFQEELKKEKPSVVKTNNHSVTAAIKKYIEKRSGGKCEHPNCSKPGKHIHHTEPFAFKRLHDPDKLVHLCEEHHQIIHLGYIDDSNIAPVSNSWHQIEKLPAYDIKNIINNRIAEFRYNH